MDWTILWWILAILVVIAGLAGTVIPALPGVPLVFLGLFLGAWIGQFEAVGWGTLGVLAVLGLIDVVMISNLLVMVIVGGYETFVSRLRLEDHPDQPEWLSHVNATVLKVKLAMAIIGISSIHLLKTFIAVGALGTDATSYTETGVMWQTIIHVVFILSAIGIAWTDKLMSQAIATAQQKGEPAIVG